MPNLPRVDTVDEKMIGGLPFLVTVRTGSHILQPMSMTAICRPDTPSNRQPREEFHFERRPCLPNRPSSGEAGGSLEEQSVGRPCRVCGGGSPSPSNLILGGWCELGVLHRAPQMNVLVESLDGQLDGNILDPLPVA